MDLELITDFRSIVLEERPLLDVRAPVEFEKGAFPKSTNIPILNDEERRLVGICYKEHGNTVAVALGRELINPSVQEERVREWTAFIKANPNAYLYCFRGGQRSQISQMWLDETGVKIPRLKGGYKAFRNFLMNESERIAQETKTLILGGRTGSGKTLLLNTLENSIDLEGLANHRGSSFGRFVQPQPSQISFEDALAYQLIKHEVANHKHLVVEHEGHNVGRVYMPKPIFTAFRSGELVILETPMPKRLQITFEEYVTQGVAAYEESYGNEGMQVWFDDVSHGLKRITKRLGSERYLQIKSLFEDAFAAQKSHGELEGHKEWIEILLRDYYDPMYDYQIEHTEMPIVFRGNENEVRDYLTSRG